MCASSIWSATSAAGRTRHIASVILPAALLVLLVGLAIPAGASAAGPRSQATPPVAVSALPPGEVEEVLSGIPLEDLSATQLSEVLSKLPGLSALPAGPLQQALVKTIEGLAAEGDTLGQLASSRKLVTGLEGQLDKLLSPSELLSLLQVLKGQSLSSKLTSALGSLDSSQMVGGLLSSASNPEQLIEEVLAAPSPEKLETLLGTTLAGEPFTTSTVGELATRDGMTAEGLAEDLDTTSSQLPASAMALTTPLTNGKTLGVLDAVDGIDLGVLETLKEKTPEGSGGSGSGEGGSGDGSGGAGDAGGGAGGSGGAGGGSSGPAAGTTIVVNDLRAQEDRTSHANLQTIPAKVKILSHRVKGDAVTIVAQAPAAGKLTLSGKGIRSVSEQTDKAERVTLRTLLTKAVVTSLREHHRLKLELTTSFKSVGGARSSTTTAVAFA
jgi:uncharacterized membrane protein YgcG